MTALSVVMAGRGPSGACHPNYVCPLPSFQISAKALEKQAETPMSPKALVPASHLRGSRRSVAGQNSLVTQRPSAGDAIHSNGSREPERSAIDALTPALALPAALFFEEGRATAPLSPIIGLRVLPRCRANGKAPGPWDFDIRYWGAGGVLSDGEKSPERSADDYVIPKVALPIVPDAARAAEPAKPFVSSIHVLPAPLCGESRCVRDQTCCDTHVFGVSDASYGARAPEPRGRRAADAHTFRAPRLSPLNAARAAARSATAPVTSPPSLPIALSSNAAPAAAPATLGHLTPSSLVSPGHLISAAVMGAYVGIGGALAVAALFRPPSV